MKRKLSPQRKRRAEWQSQWRVVKQQILNRDGGHCIKHRDRPAVTVHHFFGRNTRKDLALSENYLGAVCQECHGDEANTKERTGEFINILAKLHPEYKYPPEMDYYRNLALGQKE